MPPPHASTGEPCRCSSHAGVASDELTIVDGEDAIGKEGDGVCGGLGLLRCDMGCRLRRGRPVCQRPRPPCTVVQARWRIQVRAACRERTPALQVGLPPAPGRDTPPACDLHPSANGVSRKMQVRCNVGRHMPEKWALVWPLPALPVPDCAILLLSVHVHECAATRAQSSGERGNSKVAVFSG